MASGEDIKKDILKRSQELIDDKKIPSQQNLGIHYVEKYSLYTDLDLMAICLDQAEQKNVENIIRLIGKQSKYEVEEKKKLQTTLIEALIKSRNSKVADQLCGKFDIPLENYPLLVEQKIRGAVRFFLSSFLRKKEDEKEYLGLDKIENLFEDLKDCQAHLCEQLWFAGKRMEAKGVFDRSKLMAEEVNKVSNGKEVGTELKNMKYDKAKDFKPTKDMFEPISTPAAEFLRFPLNIKIEFIDTESKIDMLKDLVGQRFIGVDAEWRP
jgi:hypothetical protein